MKLKHYLTPQRCSIILGILLILSLAGMFLLAFSNQSAQASLAEENAALERKLSAAESEKQVLEEKIASLEQENDTLTGDQASYAANIQTMGEEMERLLQEADRYYAEKMKLEQQLDACSEELDFYREHIAFIPEGQQFQCYHTYECTVFKNCTSFLAYNVVAAENLGYEPCYFCWIY